MPLILPARTLDSGYNIENSLRFNDGDNPKLQKTTGSTGDRRQFTFSCWFKNAQDTGADQTLFSCNDGTHQPHIKIDTTNQQINVRISDSGGWNVMTNMSFRDYSAWYHLVVAMDTEQGTAANRLKIYVNGEQQTSLATSDYPDEDADTSWNSNTELVLGRDITTDNKPFDGYISEVFWIDGTQYAASAFGETDVSGIWKPKDCKDDLTFGTHGFYFEFKQTGTGTDSSGIGADTSGNNNHYAVTNLAAIDQTTDTPTNNFCTLNPLDVGSDLRDNGSFAEGNLSLTNGDTSGQANEQRVRGTIGVTAGKWYFETKPTGGTAGIGVSATEADPHGGDSTNTLIMHYDGGGEIRYYNGSGRTTVSSGVDTYTDDDIVQCALDMDNNKVYFGKNGTWQMSGDPTSGATGTGSASIVAGNTMTPMGFDNSSGSAGLSSWNFGNPIHSISSGNADANGYGNFEYAPPSGYYALCTKNLANYG